MIGRCTNPKHKKFSDYGGRGIKVCERWLTFENFYADMGDPPIGMVLDRENNSGDYEPGNVRWTTTRISGINRRMAHMLTFENKTQTILEWSEQTQIPYHTLYSRIYRGKTPQEALAI